jgi:hypothetical protein
MILKIRPFQETDAEPAGKLIAETYRKYNLSFVSTAEQGAYLGPFQFADSKEEAHREDIAQALQASMVYVAENEQDTAYSFAAICTIKASALALSNILSRPA